MLEETALPCEIVEVKLAAGGRFSPGFARLGPKREIPAIVDGGPAPGDFTALARRAGIIGARPAIRRGMAALKPLN